MSRMVRRFEVLLPLHFEDLIRVFVDVPDLPESRQFFIEFKEKLNIYSGESYRFIKFIGRKLIRIPTANSELTFFYPLEVQIMDYQTFLHTLSGPAAHAEYKTRQKQAARLRVIG